MSSPFSFPLPSVLDDCLAFEDGGLIAVSYAGYLDPESDGSLEEDLASRRYRALLPDDDYYDSDDY